MTVNQLKFTIAFDEQDEEFVRQLAGDIGCQYSKANARTYNLSKSEPDVQSGAGVFAWVHKHNKDHFWVSTRKDWVEQAKAMVQAGENQSDMSCFPRVTQHADDSVCLDTSLNYQKSVAVLSLIQDSR
ncbi:MAG TPA: hypothetical protein PKO23_17075 [Candidatus Hydrogenedentes bacterium]|nr:hypothetical protein [Candidatus Hydrogenedentota bacterium]